MRSMTSITALSDRESLPVIDQIITCYHDLLNRARHSADEFFPHISEIISDIQIGVNPDVTGAEILYEFFHRTWSFCCSIEGRSYLVGSSIDIIQNSKHESSDEDDVSSSLPFYWAVTSMMQCADLDGGQAIQVRIGPFFSDEEGGLVLSASVILVDSGVHQMRRMFLSEPNDEDNEKICNEIVREIGEMVEGVIDHIVDPVEADTEEDTDDCGDH